MTLLTEPKTTPAAGGQPPATPDPATPPSSGDKVVDPGEQTAAGKEPPTPETPPAKAAKTKDDKAGEKPSGTPESYQPFTTPKEGRVLAKNELEAFSSVARELNLSQEAAQKIIDKMSPAFAARTTSDVTTMIEGWIKETREDPTIGGDKLNTSVALAQRALDLAGPELRQLLGPLSEGGTGLGNHKAVIAGLAAIGRRLSPDAKVVSGGEPSPPPKDPLQRLAESYDQQKD